MVNDSPYSRFTSEQIKHLEMLQAVITRLGGNGFLVRGWAVTVAGALLALAVNNSEAGLAYVNLVPLTAFWLLDGYLLWSERCFRALFDTVRASDGAVAPFTMSATSREVRQSAEAAGNEPQTWLGAVLRPAVLIFYAALAVATVVTGILVA